MEINTSELLPCPFCGGSAEEIEVLDEENWGGFCICCSRCNANGPVQFGEKATLKEHWNTRTIPDELEAE